LAKNSFISRLLFDSDIVGDLRAVFSFYPPVFCLRALIHEFERRSLKIIHGAATIYTIRVRALGWNKLIN